MGLLASSINEKFLGMISLWLLEIGFSRACLKSLILLNFT